jgi:hypothetical protein
MTVFSDERHNVLNCLPMFGRGLLSRLQGENVNVGDVDVFTERNQSTTTHDVKTKN